MNDTYTHQEVMEKLGIVSHNSFLQLMRKYPHAFVVTKKTAAKNLSTYTTSRR